MRNEPLAGTDEVFIRRLLHHRRGLTWKRSLGNRYTKVLPRPHERRRSFGNKQMAILGQQVRQVADKTAVGQGWVLAPGCRQIAARHRVLP